MPLAATLVVEGASWQEKLGLRQGKKKPEGVADRKTLRKSQPPASKRNSTKKKKK